MLDQPIESLREYIKTTANMLKDQPNGEELNQDIYALVSAVNVLEIYHYGKHQTKLGDYLNQ